MDWSDILAQTPAAEIAPQRDAHAKRATAE